MTPDAVFYQSQAWRKVRRAVLRERGFTCKSCGSDVRHAGFRVVHIKARDQFPALALVSSNCVLLCWHCWCATKRPADAVTHAPAA